MNDETAQSADGGHTSRPPPHRAPEPKLIAGVGASAGGLESLERLFTHMPADTGIAFVVVQHLSPNHKSAMAELLARRTALAVHTAADRLSVRPDCIYLLPPGKDMALAADRLLLSDRDEDGLHLPIDHFFRSLAETQGERAAAVVLSGTGSDGARGVEAVKARGGLVLSESDTTAKFSGMPQSAEATGCVDYVLAPEQMPQALLAHLRRRAGVAELPPLAPDGSADPEPLTHDAVTVLRLLHQRYGIDFSHYRPSTVGRRIERRIELSAADSVGDYIERLRQQPEELERLYHDLLIGVTQFFRDRACFQALENDALPPLVKRLKPGEPVRAWVAGCATGEEAYSIAILLFEQLGQHAPLPEIKIFATDMHPESLAVAGRGIYPAERLEGLSEARKNAHFERHPESGGFRVRDHLRQMIVFARHNVLKEAPFTNLHLITCRNLLIYFQPAAQRKVLTLFHFALKTQGLLMLGPSESLGELAPEFDSISEPAKIYRKYRHARLPRAMNLELPSLLPGSTSTSMSMLSPTPLPSRQQEIIEAGLLAAYDTLLNQHMPPSILVNERLEVVDSYGGAARLLRFSERRPSRDLLAALDSPFSAGLSGALRKAQHDNATVTLNQVRLRDAAGAAAAYQVTVAPVASERHPARYLLITLRADQPLPPAPTTDTAATEDRAKLAAEAAPADAPALTELESLSTELRYTKENLQATIEELESSNEELQATNEELVASNEELQASNEELNSVNEELHTVNAEYQSKINELRELNEDMNHLLASTDIGTVFLDRELNIRRFTPGISRAFRLTPSDIGRAIATFAHRLNINNLDDKLRRVLASGELFEQEVRDRDYNALLLRILPYQIAGQIGGVVLTVTDIRMLDEARAALADSEAGLRRRLAELQTVYDTAPVGLCFVDTQLRYVRVNRRLAEIDGVNVSDYRNRRVGELLPPALAEIVRGIFRQVIASGEPRLNLKIRGKTAANPDQERDYLASYYPVTTDDGDLLGVNVMVQPITDD